MTLIERFESTGAAKRFFIVLVVFVLIMAAFLPELVVLIMAAFLPELVIENKIFLAPDVKAPLSFATVGKEALSWGIYPLWNPYIFCGMPSFSSLAYTPYVSFPGDDMAPPSLHNGGHGCLSFAVLT